MASRTDVLERVSSTDTVDALWALMVEYWTLLGFGAVSYFLLKRGQPELPIAIFRHGDYLNSIGKIYAELGYARDDPYARYALTTGKPLLVSRMEDLPELSRKEARFIRKMEALVSCDVVVFPVFGPNTVNGLFVVAALKESAAIAQMNWDEVQSVAQIAHLRVICLQPQTTRALPNPLSERELDILRWVAQGKSNGVIADIMDISAGTVDTYLRRIFDKLDVTDRTTAAVRGVSSGLIRA